VNLGASSGVAIGGKKKSLKMIKRSDRRIKKEL
jgi:hypothetical protein